MAAAVVHICPGRIAGRVKKQSDGYHWSSRAAQVVCVKACLRPIEVSRQLASARHAESRQPQPLFQDPYATQLAAAAADGPHQLDALEAARHIVATKYIDESIMNAMAATNVGAINSGDYRQVVLVGDGMDTRPFRLLWPPGTLLFLVAPAEVHEHAEALLSTSIVGAHVMRGCLLRRVNLNWGAAAAAPASASTSASATASGTASATATTSGQQEVPAVTPPTTGVSEGSSSSTSTSSSGSATILFNQLEKAGFRGDRLSVWAVQGLHQQGVHQQQLQELLAEITNAAAFNSLLVGELPVDLNHREAENVLADVGLLGSVISHAEADGGSYKRWNPAPEQDATTSSSSQPLVDGSATHTGEQATHPSSSSSSSSSSSQVRSPSVHPSSSSSSSSSSGSPSAAGRWLFTAQQQRLSLQQMDTYEDHVAAAEAADEDFFGNFS